MFAFILPFPSLRGTEAQSGKEEKYYILGHHTKTHVLVLSTLHDIEGILGSSPSRIYKLENMINLNHSNVKIRPL